MRLAQHVVALLLQLAGQLQQGRHRWQEDTRGLAGSSRPDEPADHLGEEQRRRRAGGVHAHGEPRHVDTLGDHAHRDQPPAAAPRERRDAVRRTLVVGQHDRRRLAADLGQQLGVRAGRRLVGGDDHAAGVRYVLTLLRQSGVGGGDHRGHPLACRVERGPPGPRGVLGGQRLTQPGRVLLARAVPPPRLAGVRQEHHRSHDAVGQRVGVAVRVVGLRALQAVGTAFVGDERDRAVVAAKRCTGQREPPRRVAERLPDGLAPGLGVAAVVDLVEHHQRATVLGAHPVPAGVLGHLGVGDDDPVVLVGVLRRGVAELRVERDACARCGLRPLHLEVLGGNDDRDPVDDALGEQFSGDAKSESGLACSWRRHREKITRSGRQIAHQSPTLPAPQSLGAGRCVCPHPKTPIWSEGSLGHPLTPVQ